VRANSVIANVYEICLVQTLGLDLSSYFLASLDFNHRDLFVLRSGISSSRSPLSFCKRYFIRHLSVFCPRLRNFRLDSVAHLIEVVTTLRRVLQHAPAVCGSNARG
jgi:hypothetical protein